MEMNKEIANEQKAQEEQPMQEELKEQATKQISKKKKIDQKLRRKLIQLIPAFVLTVVVTATVIVFLILDVKEGWNGEKTITYSLLVITLICWLALYSPINSYLISNNSSMMKSNNELFATLEKVEKANKLYLYKQIKDNQARDKQLEKINNFLLSKNPNFVPLAHDNIQDFMDSKAYQKKPLSFDFDDGVQLQVLYMWYKDKFSKEYEKMYSDYKTTNLIKREPFPLFNTILPFVLSAIALFGLIYQDVNLAENQSHSLTSYLVVIAEIILFGIIFSFNIARNSIPALIKENNKEIELLKSLID